jgi:hypothetical protein
VNNGDDLGILHVTTRYEVNTMIDTATDESRMTEAEFLDRQVADAQAAFQKTWSELKSTLRETATLEVWAERHPWMVAGGAVTGGFLLASLLFSPKHQEAVEAAAAEQNGRQHAAGPGRDSNWLIDTLFSLLKPVLGQLITSLIAATMGAVGGSMANATDQPPDDQSPGTGDGSPTASA